MSYAGLQLEAAIPHTVHILLADIENNLGSSYDERASMSIDCSWIPLAVIHN
jgi:hypothetical protein